jgi:hypothetical protein
LRAAIAAWAVVRVADRAEKYAGGLANMGVRSLSIAWATKQPRRIFALGPRWPTGLFREVPNMPNERQAEAACCKFFDAGC